MATPASSEKSTMNGKNEAVPSYGGLSHICCPSSALGALEDEPATMLVPNSSFKSRVVDVGGPVGNDSDRQGQPNGAAAAAAPPSTTATGFFSKKSRQPIINKPDFLPILIIPGFMSSGLEIQKSNLRPDWEGKRLWLNLSSLGLSAFYFGSAQATTKKNNNNNKQQPNEQQEEQQQQSYKSHWLEHMRLDSNYQERPGIQVRPIQGLEGVDYLTPGAFTNHVSYVFGPVIQALQSKSNGAYKPNVNLQAAPYDWRLSPSQLEERDGYFTTVQHQVEGLYQMNGNTPVVVVGHSLGTKTAHYFFNFMANKPGCGREWLDKYIHTYIPVGAPHLGAPKALRSVVAGDKMGLDAFLDDEEALAMGRSFGSGPWLFPSHLPPGVPSSVYVMPHGVLEISFVQGSNGDQEAAARAANVNTYDLVHNRTALSKPNRYQLIVAYSGPKSKDDKDEGEQKVSTPFVGVIPGQQYVVQFSDQISFATNPNPKIASQGQLRFFLQEPGIAAAKEEKKEQFCCGFNPICCLLKCIFCCCLCDLIYKLVRWITCGIVGRGVALGADVISSGFGGGTNLASSYPVTIPPDVWTGRKGYVQRQVPLYHKDDLANPYERILCFFVRRQPRSTTLHVRMRWIPDSKNRNGSKSGTQQTSAPVVCQPNPKEKTQLKITRRNKRKQVYQEIAGHEILEREGLASSTLELIRRVYDKDTEVGPRTKSSYNAPPVKRVHAIYGINIPTEVGGVYRRKDGCCLSKNKLDNLYKLDAKAIHCDDKKSGGFMIQNGVIYETPETKQSVAGHRPVCGDGTVPYWSLQHCKTWRSDDGNSPGARLDVSVIELDKAEHREILADARFHQALLDYCYIGGDPA